MTAPRLTARADRIAARWADDMTRNTPRPVVAWTGTIAHHVTPAPPMPGPLAHATAARAAAIWLARTGAAQHATAQDTAPITTIDQRAATITIGPITLTPRKDTA